MFALKIQQTFNLAMALGNDIRTERINRGWTLEMLSELSGVDVGTISALEKRDSKKSQYAFPLLEALGLIDKNQQAIPIRQRNHSRELVQQVCDLAEKIDNNGLHGLIEVAQCFVKTHPLIKQKPRKAKAA